MMFSFPTAPIMILMGGFVGSKLAFNPEFSTLPIALVVVGTVSWNYPRCYLYHLASFLLLFKFASKP